MMRICNSVFKNSRIKKFWYLDRVFENIILTRDLEIYTLWYKFYGIRKNHKIQQSQVAEFPHTKKKKKKKRGRPSHGPWDEFSKNLTSRICRIPQYF